LFEKSNHAHSKNFAVCGFTEGKASRKHFGALLLGAYRNGKLCYFGLFGQRGLAERESNKPWSV
jgi:ATP-dependent DNA ligase